MCAPRHCLSIGSEESFEAVEVVVPEYIGLDDQFFTGFQVSEILYLGKGEIDLLRVEDVHHDHVITFEPKVTISSLMSACPITISSFWN